MGAYDLASNNKKNNTYGNTTFSGDTMTYNSGSNGYNYNSKTGYSLPKFDVPATDSLGTDVTQNNSIFNMNKDQVGYYKQGYDAASNQNKSSTSFGGDMSGLGMLGVGVGILKDIGSIYSMHQQNKLARKEFKFNKAMSIKNYNMALRAYNDNVNRNRSVASAMGYNNDFLNSNLNPNQSVADNSNARAIAPIVTKNKK